MPSAADLIRRGGDGRGQQGIDGAMHVLSDIDRPRAKAAHDDIMRSKKS
jgi:hypothetical protein